MGDDQHAAAGEALLKALHVAPDDFVMVGNSLRSDVAAPLAIGAWAVHVPYEISWDAEHAELPASERFREIAALSELPAVLSRWDDHG